MCINKASPLPTRVLSVGPKGSTADPHLLITDGKPGKWVALSHCWGTGTPFTTTLENIEERKRGIPFTDIPQTFQDAITISRSLEIEHLWIDSLCIIQNSDADWLAESSRMSEVYSNATITLIAEASSGSRQGIFETANAGRSTPISVPCTNSKGAHLGTIFPQKNNGKAEGVAGSYQEGPVSSRAWTLQENVLSQRILMYAPDQLFWACRTSFHSDSNPTKSKEFATVYDTRKFVLDKRSESLDQKRSRVLSFWYQIVSDYSKRGITFEKDRFPAISGVARKWLWRASVRQSCAIMELGFYSLLNYTDMTKVTDPMSDITLSANPLGDDIYSQIAPKSATAKIRGPCQSIDTWHQKFKHIYTKHGSLNYDSHKKSHFNWDAEKGDAGDGIICILIGKVEHFGGEKFDPSRVYGLLLKPTNLSNPNSEYKRNGIFKIAKKDVNMTKRWTQRTVIVT